MGPQQSLRRPATIAARTILGLVVGASFGIAVGALIASWVYGVSAIEEDAAAASYLAAAVTLGASIVGAVFGYRSARRPPEG